MFIGVSAIGARPLGGFSGVSSSVRLRCRQERRAFATGDQHPLEFIVTEVMQEPDPQREDFLVVPLAGNDAAPASMTVVQQEFPDLIVREVLDRNVDRGGRLQLTG